MNPHFHKAARLGPLLALGMAFFAGPARVAIAAGEPAFSFLAPPKTDMLRIYWLNNTSGQMGACDYAASKDKKKIGSTHCFQSGEGAGPAGSGRYELKASNHKDEGSVFRVNIDTGELSICWVRYNKTVCTVPAK